MILVIIKKGEYVKIVKGADVETYKDYVFEIVSDPYTIPSYQGCLVKMKCHETGKYFAGGYAVEFLGPAERSESIGAKDNDTLPKVQSSECQNVRSGNT
jgi:hypothetical protein